MRNRILLLLRRYGLLIIIIILLLCLQYRLWFADNGQPEVQQLKQQLAKKQAIIKQAKQRNQKLLAQVQEIEHSSEAIESHARYDLGMVKQGEEYIQLVDASTNKTNNKTNKDQE